MLQSFFRNLPPITKNILIINVLFFLATQLFETRGIDLVHILGMHYPDSYFFQPYQIISHVFMHSGFTHLLFNMIGLLVMGTQLEKVWGGKRYLIFYLVTAFGAAILHGLVSGN